MSISFRPILVAGSAALLLTACSSKPKMKTDILVQHADTTVSPANDFFEYANGGWIKDNPIPASESSWGIGNLVQNEIYTRLRKINEDAAAETDVPKGSSLQMIGDFWYSGMDSTNIEEQGIDPLKPELARIDAIKSRSDLLDEIAHLKSISVRNTFGSYISQDDKNSSMMALKLEQGGLGMPNRDYYLKKDERTTKIRKAYGKHVENMFVLLGKDSLDAQKESVAMIKLETSLATASRKLEDLRDPYANYNKMSLRQLDVLTPSISWSNMFSRMNIDGIDSVIVGQPEFYKALNEYVNSVSLDTWKAYLRYHLITQFAPELSSSFSDENFHFYGTVLYGRTEQYPRWKRVLNLEQRAMGQLLGQIFVKNYFPPKAKKRYSDLVDSVISSFRNHIKQLDWMSEVTKQKALHKLSKINKKVGYPDKWKDFTGLEITRGSLVQNVMTANEWWYHDNISKLGKPVDRSEWHMNPQTYNAYYSPSNNEIVLPAAIFTVPGMPDSLVDDAVVYGYAGASTIGHELTHGFDDEGRLYDADGNLHDWWTQQDAEQFTNRTQLMINQFNNYTVLDSLHINGKATLGENIADLGGIVIALDAFKKTDEYKEGKEIAGFTPLQRYFLGYAFGWMVESRSQRLLMQVLSDVHSPARYRVNGPMSDVGAFYQAFDVQPADSMWRPESLRVKIW